MAKKTVKPETNQFRDLRHELAEFVDDIETAACVVHDLASDFSELTCYIPTAKDAKGFVKQNRERITRLSQILDRTAARLGVAE